MMVARPHLSLKTKLAAALLEIDRLRAVNSARQRCIPYEHAKAMSDSQILSLHVWDHYPIRKADGGPDQAWNLTPRLISEHRAKTAQVDVPEMAKSKRIRAKEARHRGIMDRAPIEVVKWEDWAPKRRILGRLNPWPSKKIRRIQKTKHV